MQKNNAQGKGNKVVATQEVKMNVNFSNTNNEYFNGVVEQLKKNPDLEFVDCERLAQVGLALGAALLHLEPYAYVNFKGRTKKREYFSVYLNNGVCIGGFNLRGNLHYEITPASHFLPVEEDAIIAVAMGLEGMNNGNLREWFHTLSLMDECGIEVTDYNEEIAA